MGNNIITKHKLAKNNPYNQPSSNHSSGASSKNQKRCIVRQKSGDLSPESYDYLHSITKLSKDEIKHFYLTFVKDFPGICNKFIPRRKKRFLFYNILAVFPVR